MIKKRKEILLNEVIMKTNLESMINQMTMSPKEIRNMAKLIVTMSLIK